MLPLITVMVVNFVMTRIVLPSFNSAFLAEPRLGAISLAAVGVIWSVAVALCVAIAVLVGLGFGRLPRGAEGLGLGL